MANNYTMLSTFYVLPKEKHDRAAEVMGPAAVEWMRGAECPDDLIDEEAPLSSLETRVEFHDKDGDSPAGVWFAHDESADPDLVAKLISALQKEFARPGDEPFAFSYCFMCSKPRVGEFGGGAYAVLPDGKIFHCDALDDVKDRAETLLARRENAGRKKGRKS